MIRPVSKTRTVALLNDYQVFKGQCQNSMKHFGQPVSALHEAELMIEDDRRKQSASEDAMYAIHQRSEHRILSIVEKRSDAVQMPLAA